MATLENVLTNSFPQDVVLIVIDFVSCTCNAHVDEAVRFAPCPDLSCVGTMHKRCEHWGDHDYPPVGQCSKIACCKCGLQPEELRVGGKDPIWYCKKHLEWHEDDVCSWAEIQRLQDDAWSWSDFYPYR